MKLDLIQTFVEVVRAGGFTAAARHTQMPRSTVSLQVKMLEEALGVRLLKRSTRSLALTDEGQRLYGHRARWTIWSRSLMTCKRGMTPSAV